MTALTGQALVGDIGGTNARLALCNLADGTLSDPIIYSALENDSLESVIHKFRQETKVDFKAACIAIACPVNQDYIKMTNNPWEFSQSQMKANLGLDTLLVINDFTAMSMSVTCLPRESLVKIGGGEPDPTAPIAVYGAGTGLGVAHLIKHGDKWIPLSGEGGHVDFAPNSEEEAIILEILRAEIGHVSAERVLSGPGLVNLYRAIVKADNRLPENLKPKDITERALADSCTDCRRALSLFCVIMGRFGGNLALNLGTFGGVFIAGGIVPRFLEFFKASGFRAAFEDKGRFKEYVHDIPVYLIVHDNPGLLGSGAHLRQTLGHIL